jgi:hypothetical protein
VNVYLGLQLTCLLLSAICCCRLYLFSVLLDACPFSFLQYTALPAFCNCSLFFLCSLHVGSCPSSTLRWDVPNFSHWWKPSPLQAHWGRWCHSCLLRSACLFTVCVRECPPPLSGGACHTVAIVTSLPLSKHTGGGGTTPVFSGQLVYLQFCEGVPLLHSP